MKNNYLILETLADLIRYQDSLHNSLLIIGKIFNLEKANEAIELLNNGNDLIKVISCFNDDNLFIEFFNFYLQTNTVDQAILKALSICKKKDVLKKNIIKNLIYPALLLIGLLIFSFVAVFYLQPQFQLFFESFDVKLSIFTQLSLNLLFAMPIILFVLIIFIIIVIIYFVMYLKSQTFDQLKLWLKIPILGYCLKKYYTLKFCLYYKELVKLKYDFSTITKLLLDKIDDSCLKMIIFEIKEEIIKGKSLDDIINQQIFFDDYFKMIFNLALYHSSPFSLLEQYYTTTINLIEINIKRYVSLIVSITYGAVGIYIIGIYMGMIMPMMNMLENI